MIFRMSLLRYGPRLRLNRSLSVDIDYGVFNRIYSTYTMTIRIIIFLFPFYSTRAFSVTIIWKKSSYISTYMIHLLI
jgi:hypothetical protein